LCDQNHPNQEKRAWPNSTFWFALASSDALLFARGLKNAYPDLDVTIREVDVAPLQVQGPKSSATVVEMPFVDASKRIPVG
jgi:aminomethyltransferase